MENKKVMLRKRLLILIAVLAAFAITSCQKSNNINVSPNANASPLPPGLSTSPLPPGPTPTPGIPDVNAPKNNNQPSGTPTPGIPDLNSKSKSKTPPMSESTTPSKGPITSGQLEKRRP
jgi:hypothetical protein